MPARSRDVPRRAAPLTREAIARAALQRIDAEGLEALSMRGLGSALGVEAMALYHHYQNKAELLDDVLDLLLDEIERPLSGRGTPLQRLRRAFEEVRQMAIRHPHAFWLLPTRRFRTRRALDFYEHLLRAFREAGFAAAESARFFRLLGGFTTGAGLAEIGSRAQQPDATPIVLESFAEGERYPHVSEVVPHLRVAKLDAVFRFGLDVIFDAMERALKKK